MGLFEKLVKIYLEVGLFRVILLTILFFLIIFIYDIIRRLNPIIIEAIMRRRIKADFGISEKRLAYMMNVTVKGSKIFCEKRKLIFSDFVNSRIKSFIKMIDTIKKDKVNDFTNDELYYYMKEKIWGTLHASDELLLVEKIPRFVIEKYRQLEDDEFKMLERLITQVCFSKNIYRSNSEKIMVILDFLCVAGEVVLINGENLVDKLNGELDGIIYKGIDCTSCAKTNCKHKEEKKSNV